MPCFAEPQGRGHERPDRPSRTGSGPAGGGEGAGSGTERPPIIEVEGLTKEYGDGRLALRGVSFVVGKGEIFGFIGPNGAGKTTTIRILATLLEPTSGRVRVDGMCVQDDTEEVRRLVGYMPDVFDVYDGLDVEEYLDFFAAAYHVPRRRRRSIVEGIMELTDLTGLRERMVSHLSRGMRQRLCLARALVNDPKVLVLDEPASSLDPRARIELRALLKELRAMGKTVFISSHILSELSDLCTSVGIIEKGCLVGCGNVKTLGSAVLKTRRVRIGLEDARPDIEKILERHGLVSNVAVHRETVVFDYSGSPAEFYTVLRLLVDHHVPVLSVEQESPDLENLFLELTSGDVQ